MIETPLFREILFNKEPSPFLQNKYLFTGGIWTIIVFSMFRTKYISKCITDNLIGKILSFTGKISYEIYLVHAFVLGYLAKYNLDFMVFIILGLVISIMISYIINWLFETINNSNRKQTKLMN